jgi:hypothetical protein
MFFSVAAMIVGALVLTGCGDSGNDNNVGGIVLPAGQAWTDGHIYESGNLDGIIFQPNGTALLIHDYSGDWMVFGQFEYSLRGGTITAPGIEDFSISNNGDTLTIFYEDDYVGTYTRTTGVNVTPPPTPTGGNVILPEGEAWTDGHIYEVGNLDGFIFLPDGIALHIVDYSGVWEVEDLLEYSVNGNLLTMFDETFHFAVSSNGNTLTIFDQYGSVTYIDTYTKTAGVYPELDDFSMEKKGSGAAPALRKMRENPFSAKNMRGLLNRQKSGER